MRTFTNDLIYHVTCVIALEITKTVINRTLKLGLVMINILLHIYTLYTCFKNNKRFHFLSHIQSIMVENKVITIHEQWHPILGKEIPLIEPYHYIKLSKILSSPKLSAHESGSVDKVLPYIRQKVKMWGADVLRAENIKTLIDEDDELSDEESIIDESQDLERNQLSRFDCIASLLASAECTVAQDIFRTLSQFPIAFPLVMPELDNAGKFKVMLPSFTGPIIKWETNPGTIIENHLFNDPFQLVVAVRIGTNSSGKSTILNQVMTSNSMFSSCSDPRAEYGKPHMISGSIEFTWLTQETCNMSLWNDVFENYYKEGTNKIILLANLHGDALDYPDQIQFLKQFPSSFLVFLMPDYTEDKLDEFKVQIGSKKVVYRYVNHKKSDKHTINTNHLTHDKTLKKVRMMFKEALNIDTPDTSPFKISDLKLGKSLQFAEDIEIPASQLLVDFVKEHTCRRVKLNVMQLQRKQQSDDGLQIWKNNPDLQVLIRLYKIVLKLPLEKRRQALAHLEREISRLSMIESSEARIQALLKKEELRKSGLVNRSQKDEKKIQDEIAKIWKEVDDMSLGLEHFFRELGQLYKIFSVNDPSNEIVVELPKLYSELLISGHTIELLNGDTGTISEAWFSAICKHICNEFPKLRIFVISILGLQSSGKSTLLNALFACRFAVSVGRCTRGLFMRLLFLEKDLSDQLNVDAFILIDTEGLGAPEKMNDPESEKKDRILTTFAMGVSNLTILNVLGESTRDLTEILQIAIVTMARLEKVGMAPDILMVQHVSERNIAKISEPEEKFREALREALKIADEQDIEMGISNTDCLQILDERIRNGQLLKPFRPFKNGATAYAPPSEQYHEDVVNLYNSIVNDCKNSQNKMEFSQWHSLIHNYWKAVSHENFAVRFKNIKEIYEFIDLGKRITKLKETIDRSFQKHEESIMKEIRFKLLYWSPNDKSNINSVLRDVCLKLIENELRDVPDCNIKCKEYEETDEESELEYIICEECEKTNKERIELEEYLQDKNNEKCETETKQTIENYIKLNRQSVFKKLTQMLEANFIRKGISSESLDIINKHLENILKNMPDEGFSDQQREQKIDEVWNLLQNHISSKDCIITIEEQIDNEVKEEYYKSSVELYQHYKNGTVPDLRKCKAYKKFHSIKHLFSQYIDLNDLLVLEGKLDNLIDNILKRASYQFYPGIIRDLKKEISQICPNYYLPEFKWNVHLCALLMFKPKMISYQEKWDRENTPLGILNQKKDEYLKIINTRLQYGHTLVSEGHIVADYLVSVIYKKAMHAGDNERKDAVRNIAWLTCAESIRLKYFENLAEKVQNGDKEEAIRHFLNPKRRIESWFVRTVNNNSIGNPEKKYKETFSAEFKRVFQEIRNCQSFEEIKTFVNNYMIQVDKVDYKLDLNDQITENDLKIFQDTIEKELETKGNSHPPRHEPFQNPSDDKSIMERLGCTEACFWCGALCWGSRDHHENSDKTKIHHSSHQPAGLACAHDKHTNELRATPCHNRSDDTNMWYFNKNEPTKWSIAKVQDFSDWKFDPHCMHIFNDLMCWFFGKLHKDLAERCNLKPAPHKDLKKNGCLNLDYDDIISILKTKIGE
jgi:GTPase Era involved in 16S rRNA processing